MAKKKRPTDQPTPALSGEPSKDQHRSNRLVRLPEWLHDMMKDLAKENDRPVTREIRRSLIAHLKAHGKKLPPDAGADLST